MNKASWFTAAAVLAVSAGPAAAQSVSERVGDWTVAKIAVSEGGNVCSALRLYGGGYGLEVIEARGLPGQLILRLESPQINYRPGSQGDDIDGGEHLEIVIGKTIGQEGSEAIVRQGPRGLGFVATLRDTNDPLSVISNLRSGQAIRAYTALPDGSKDKTIGIYSLAGSRTALDALARCVDGGVAAARSTSAPAPAPSHIPGGQNGSAAEGLPVPFGRYTADGNCANAHLMLTPNYWGDDADGEGWVIGPFRNLGSNRWALSPALTIVVTGPRSFTIKGRAMTWCAP
ncbi:MAG: hypothetical protein J7496_05175 [Novosphingobium sp.]|nr:hypothetical protein [Novosphingobium sp.]